MKPPKWTERVECGTPEAGAIYGERGPADPYRYVLWRNWHVGAPLFAPQAQRTVAFVMLNPSTATHERVDPTVTRCIGYARAWGFTGLLVLNLFALRATDPRKLARATDPVGPLNDELLEAWLPKAELVICAWGNGGALHQRSRVVLGIVQRAGRPPMGLQWTKAGEPSHPLYLPALLSPQPFPEMMQFSRLAGTLNAGLKLAQKISPTPREPGEEG